MSGNKGSDDRGASVTKEMVRKCLELQNEAWNAGDVDALDDILADNFVRHGASGDSGREEFKETIREVRQAFADFRSEIEDIFATGDKVAFRWSASGTHVGEYFGVPSTGRTATTHGITINRFVNGRLAQQWSVWDTQDLLKSLGVSRFPIS